MTPDTPIMIEPEKYAVSGKHLTGDLALKDMVRLCELILNDDGIVVFSLDFRKDDKGIIHIQGEISASLEMLCQRCLNKMEFDVQNSVNVGIVRNRDEIELLPNNLEPLMAEDKKVSLTKLIEEELLLCLPLSPLHSVDNCSALETIKAYKATKDNPFAVLKSIKNGKK